VCGVFHLAIVVSDSQGPGLPGKKAQKDRDAARRAVGTQPLLPAPWQAPPAQGRG
jgi:hypothetical protein